jgi:putative flippase GtrA
MITDWVRTQLGHEAGPFVQFVKYGIVGGMATAVNMVVFFLCGWYVLPCLTPQDPLVRLFRLTAPMMGDGTRAWRSAVCFTIGFIVSNIVCYFLNRAFVFKPGRYSWWKEFLLFFAGSGLSFVIGTGLQTVLIKSFGVQTSPAFLANLVAALLINYATRKFIIFKG